MFIIMIFKKKIIDENIHEHVNIRNMVNIKIIINFYITNRM